MYFAILWKHTHISMEELRYLQPTSFRTYNEQIVFFDTEYPQRIEQLAGIVKRWTILNYNELKPELENCPIIGVHDAKHGQQLKKHFGIKRFKLLDLLRSDREIKKKGKEILVFQTKEGQSYGLVTGYQNIKRYEVIDFGKPARSMKVGMMPAKLTHIMINIWLTYTAIDTMSNIYDPFCGLGTTVLMANALGYHAIGSDIQPEHAQKNINRRKKQGHCEDKHSEDAAIQNNINKLATCNLQLCTKKNMYIFQHDVTKPFTEPKLQNAPLIVTEWRLGPMVTQKTDSTQIAEYSRQVEELYSAFLTSIHAYYQKTQLPTIVITIPYYIKQENIIAEYMDKQATKLWRESKIIKEIYSRPKQYVGRQIMILTAKT